MRTEGGGREHVEVRSMCRVNVLKVAFWWHGICHGAVAVLSSCSLVVTLR